MRQASDHFTIDLIDRPGRGRPRKPDALTPAQRARRYRQRLSLKRSIPFDLLAGLVLDFIKPQVNLA